jgi:DHA1 family tetracycline resistance protein-like MFS transporter
MLQRNHAAATGFIFVTVLLDMMAIGIIAPVLPKLVAIFTGGNLANAALYIGLFATVWAMMQFFCSPLLGMLSDRVGRRPVILLSNGVTAIDYVIMALAPNLWWLFLGRVLSGVATASISTASAYIADVTDPEKRAAAYGILGSAFGLGFILGPVIGGFAGNVDPRLPFWIAAAFSAVNALYGLLVLPESLPKNLRTPTIDWKRANPLGSLHLLQSHRELYGLTWVTFVGDIAHECLPNIWVLYCIAQFAWDARAIGLTLMLVGLSGALSSAFLVGPLVKRFGERRILLFSLVVAAVSYVMFGSQNGLVFLLAVPVSALALFGPTSQALMTRRVGASEQGELQGALGAVRGISMLVGPGLFTFVFALFAGQWKHLELLGAPMYLAAALVAVAFAIAVRVTTRADDDVHDVPQPGPPNIGAAEEPALPG